MAKQKVVIKVSMKNQKSRSKAMKIAVGVPEVESASVQGDYKDQIEVTGEGIDSVRLTSLLRNKFCYANLVSVADVEEKKEKKEEEAIWTWTNSVPPYCSYPVYEIIRNSYQYEDPYNCSIM